MNFKLLGVVVLSLQLLSATVMDKAQFVDIQS